MAVLVTTPRQLDALVAALEHARDIAVDTEFHGERSWFPKLMLLQLRADAGEIWLVDPLAELDLARLGPPLTRARLLLHGGSADLALLQRYTGATPKVVFDTQIAAAFAGFAWPSRLSDLSAALVGKELEKGETLSDWSRRPLSPAQLRYAAEDVELLGAMVAAIETRLDVRKAAWAEEETREMVRTALAPEDFSQAWLRIHGTGPLSRAERATLCALAAWRDETAQSRDMPRNTVVSDPLLVDVARRRPRSVDALRTNRRMPAQVIKLWGEDLVRIACGTHPEPDEPLADPAQLDLLRAAARVVERREAIAHGMLAPETLLRRVAADRPISGWRNEAIIPAFRDFVSGRVVLAWPGDWIDRPTGT